MKKHLLVCLVSLLVGLGFGYLVFHNGANNSRPLGGLIETVASHFVNGFYAGTTDQLSVGSDGALTTSGTLTATGAINASSTLAVTGTITGYATTTSKSFATATIGNSTSVPASLGSAASGVFTVGTATPATRLGQASTTAVTANSKIFLTQTTVAPDAGTTCNTTTATSSAVTAVTPGNGFVLTVGSIPATNPQCWMYWIVD